MVWDVIGWYLMVHDVMGYYVLVEFGQLDWETEWVSEWNKHTFCADLDAKQKVSRTLMTKWVCVR